MSNLDPPEGFFDDFDGEPEACSDIEQATGAPNGQSGTPPLGEENTKNVGVLAKTFVVYDRRWETEDPPPLDLLLRDTRTATLGGPGTPFLVRGTLTMLLSEGGIGKSLLAMGLARALATGSLWLGAFQPPQPYRVKLLCGEEGLDELRWRWRRLAQSDAHRAPVPDNGIDMHPLEGEECALLAPGVVHRTYDKTDVWCQLVGELKDAKEKGNPYDVLVIDTLAIFGGPDVEIDNHAATVFMGLAASLFTQYGCTVIVVHHTNKTSRANGTEVGTSASRGASALTDRARCVWTLSYRDVQGLEQEEQDRLGRVVTFSHTKSNRTAYAKPVQLRRTSGGVLVPLDQQDIEAVGAAQAKDSKAEAKVERQKEAGRADAVACAVALLASPGASRRALRTLMYPGLDLRKERVAVALELLKPAWAEEPGRAGSGRLEVQKSLLPSWVLEKLA
jgi:hypothetical protein